jgi:hypothetical protein
LAFFILDIRYEPTTSYFNKKQIRYAQIKYCLLGILGAIASFEFEPGEAMMI